MATRRVKYSMMVLFLLVIVCLAVGQSGVTFMTPDAFAWYHALTKPSWTPPNYVFPIVWTFLYLLMAVAAWLVWREKKRAQGWALGVWGIQLLLNSLWTPLFFGHHLIRESFMLMVLYGVMVLISTVLFYRHHKLAGFLMTLYFAWVIFAGMLNFYVWQLN